MDCKTLLCAARVDARWLIFLINWSLDMSRFFCGIFLSVLSPQTHALHLTDSPAPKPTWLVESEVRSNKQIDVLKGCLLTHSDGVDVEDDAEDISGRSRNLWLVFGFPRAGWVTFRLWRNTSVIISNLEAYQCHWNGFSWCFSLSSGLLLWPDTRSAMNN